MAINVNINTSTVGASIMNAADPSAIRWIRVNADNTITYRTAAETLSDIGAQASGTYLVPADIGVTVQGYSASTTLLGNTTTGSGSIVLGTSPTITTGITAGSSAGISLISSGSSTCFLIGAGGGQNNTAYGGLKLDYGTASTVVYLDASKNLISLANGTGVLTNNGSGVLSWAAASGGITINSTAISGGGANRILFENSSNQVSESATDFYFETSSPFASVYAYGRTGTITGVNNTIAGGYQAGKSLTTGNDNYIGGYQAASTRTDVIRCIVIGSGADVNATSDRAVVIGSGAWGATSSVSVGGECKANSQNSVAVGYRCGYGVALGGSHTYSVSIGTFSNGSFAYNSSIAIGYNVWNTATHEGILGSNDSNGYIDNWYFNGVRHTAPYSVTLNASGGSGSNVAGANYTDAAGKATGNAASGNKKSQTSVKGSSGSTLQSLTDRQAIIGKYVDLTESSATTFGTLALTTSGTIAGGVIVYTVEANDGTDYQSLTGTAPYSVVNKAGTLTLTLGTDTQISACSTGTLTGTLTVAASGTSLQWQMNAVSSLSQTVLRISFQVLNNFGVATILPA